MNIKPIKSLGILAGAALLASMPLSGMAQTILYNVDAGRSTVYSGAAVLGSSGDIWNGYAGWDWAGRGNIVTLQDSTGSSAAGVTVEIWNNAGAYDNTGGTTANPLGLMQDYLNAPGWGAGDGWPIKVELANLPALTAFTLVVYAAGDASGQGGTISLATDDTFGTILQSAAVTAASRDISAGQGVAYQLFSGITSASGKIDFQVATTTDDWHALNGLQLEITPVPEPSSIALSLFGGLALLGLRRRLSR